jgi:uncharacterized protein (DUF362 family)
VQQHVRFAQAPLSRTLATLLAWTGRLTGRVPAAVKDQLDYGPFRRFCLFNIEAEQTALRCWRRLLALAAGRPELAQEFARVCDDEERHAEVFAVLAEGLDDEDRLREGETAATLAARLGEVGPFFLPASRRSPAAGGRPVVWAMQGDVVDDKRGVLGWVLEECGLEGLLVARAAALGKTLAQMRVAVKANFMIGYHRKDRSPMTDPALVAALSKRLSALGVADVAVVESPTIYDNFYRNRDVATVARYLGYESPHHHIVDASADQAPHTYLRGMAQHTVCRSWRDADFRISFAKMRSNPVDVASLTVANLEGLGPRHDQYFFAERQAQRDTAIMMLLGEFPPDLALLDAYDSASDGLLGMMGNPRPKRPRRLYASRDAVALDRVALRHMGVADPDRSRILRAARHWLGAPAEASEVRGTDEPIVGWKGPYATEWSTLLSLMAYPVYQFGSGRGTLFVPEMDEAAFPPVAPPGTLVRLLRSAIQAAFGLRHPR